MIHDDVRRSARGFISLMGLSFSRLKRLSDGQEGLPRRMHLRSPTYHEVDAQQGLTAPGHLKVMKMPGQIRLLGELCGQAHQTGHTMTA